MITDSGRVKLILASQSPRRAMLLQRHGYDFEVMPSRVEELAATSRNIEEIVVENARRKGRDVVEQLRAKAFRPQKETVVVAADTLVVMGRRVYGKPADLDEAELFMHELGGRPHRVLTGVFLWSISLSKAVTFLEKTTVVLKKMEAQEIAELFARVTPLDKAAGYGFQDAPEIVTDLQGSRTNVIGLPMRAMRRELAALVS